MASTREIVRFAGVLRGQGHEATCSIEAIKVTAPGDGASALTRQKIVSVSKKLPEGEYQLTVNGGPAVAVRYSYGHWLDGNPA
jgi:hypothetical protein